MARSELRWIACVVVSLVAGCGSEADRLCRDLVEGDVERRRTAARRLGELGADATTCIDSLRSALGDHDEDVPRLAAFALGRMGPRAVEARGDLARLLDADDHATRLTAAYALVEVAPDDDSALGVLVEAAESENPRAVVAIGQLGSTAAPAIPLLERLARGAHPLVREQAKLALERVRSDMNE